MTTEDADRESAPVPSGDATTELVKEAFDEARELARLEVALAKNEALAELNDLKVSAITVGIAAASALVGVALLLVALALALGGTIAALVTGVILLAVAAALALFAVHRLPEKPFGETRRRLKEDVQQLKERVA
jgi:hypothetical protein